MKLKTSIIQDIQQIVINIAKLDLIINNSLHNIEYIPLFYNANYIIIFSTITYYSISICYFLRLLFSCLLSLFHLSHRTICKIYHYVNYSVLLVYCATAFEVSATSEY